MIIASGAGLQEKGGLELCGAIKGDPDFKHIPFILISSIFDEISEKDRKRFQADGVISKPLNEGEILDLVDNLMQEEAAGKRGGMVSEKQEFSLDENGEGEEEIIELVDVVGEPEPRMSIDSFVPTGREKSFGEVTSPDSWGKLEFEEKPVEKELKLRPEKKIGGMDFRLKTKVPSKEALPEEEIFDKIELEEILEKVEQLKPSLEKEWPSGKEIRDIDERPFEMEEPAEKLDLSEFENALRREAKASAPQEEARPLFVEEPKKKISVETISPEELEEKPLREPLQKPLEESLEELLEGSLEEPVEVALKEPVEEALEEPLEEPLEEAVEVEEIKELVEEEFPEEFLEDLLGEEGTGASGKPETLKAEELSLEELEVEGTKEIEEIEKMEELEEVEEIGEAEQLDQVEELGQMEEMEEVRMDSLEELEPPKPTRIEPPKVARVEPPKITREEVPSLVRAVDKQVQEIISKKVNEMMGEMMTKLVPEMTQNVVGFTLERIEKMVKEVVPELAEKAIREEIERLEKGEKE
jgi:CheY-like chemotaxis protein